MEYERPRYPRYGAYGPEDEREDYREIREDDQEDDREEAFGGRGPCRPRRRPPCRPTCDWRLPMLKGALCRYVGDRVELFTQVDPGVLMPEDRVGTIAWIAGDVLKLIPDEGRGRRIYFDVTKIVGFEPSPLLGD